MSRKYGERLVKREQVTSVTCDGCGKTVSEEQDDWYCFSSYHEDWGNDSIESQEYWDACSGACYLKVVRKVVDDYGEHQNPTLTVDDKSYAFARGMVTR